MIGYISVVDISLGERAPPMIVCCCTTCCHMYEYCTNARYVQGTSLTIRMASIHQFPKVKTYEAAIEMYKNKQYDLLFRK